MDLLGTGAIPDDVTWWENDNGLGTSWTEVIIDASFDGASSVTTADFDGDGDLDVASTATVADTVSWWENNNGLGTSWTETAISTTFDGAIAVYAADVDGDGHMDIVAAAIHGNDVAWWENTTGDGSTWTEHVIDNNAARASSVHAADIDGDNDLDIVGTAQDHDDVIWWENNNGNGTSWSKHVVADTFDGAFSAYAADVDDDGDLDLIGAAFFADAVHWWENTAADGSSWTEHVLDADYNGASAVYADDVDGDGDLDILGAARDHDDITWWENLAGDGSTWEEHTVDPIFDGATAVSTSDINGDGKVDIVGAAFNAYDVAWWEHK